MDSERSSLKFSYYIKFKVGKEINLGKKNQTEFTKEIEQWYVSKKYEFECYQTKIYIIKILPFVSDESHRLLDAA